MQWFKKLLNDNIITRFIEKRKATKLYKKRLEEIKKRDPFIYK